MGLGRPKADWRSKPSCFKPIPFYEQEKYELDYSDVSDYFDDNLN